MSVRSLRFSVENGSNCGKSRRNELSPFQAQHDSDLVQAGSDAGLETQFTKQLYLSETGKVLLINQPKFPFKCLLLQICDLTYVY